MATIIRKETRKRGFFGWLFLILFILFNVLMLIWMIGGMNAATSVVTTSEAEQAGRAIGTAIGAGMILFIWVAGAVILGLFALLTRGRKTIIEETVS
ncbi:hypothetical protein GCM10011321_31390 [Youhaiella tibetensis]|uniref:Uncharacterized protein n=1 Tax=Paradevosia tibetensis TaxID=1447062 RepID=A0A5B9DI08_9HYPH|nr:hypothetical protein [Youhaiella tibetensis]QEE18900.1 hypothetical protein FNA67_01320 [Youhaiella tibetensis]GGF38173.1 hypothetical protein GCM10011321_31390 [Youhaiella tibetensis]